MSRRVPALAMLLAAALLGQDQKPQSGQSNPKQQKEELKKERPQPKTSDEQALPPEEDTSIAVTNYSFNPLQAEKELKVGNFYFKKGAYRAAASRFHEAVKWNDGYGEAWLRLGEAEEKLKDKHAAREAYTKYLAIDSEAKDAAEIRKKIEKLK
jgi:tetratricopeptide (TPR) repeat protein